LKTSTKSIRKIPGDIGIMNAYFVKKEKYPKRVLNWGGGENPLTKSVRWSVLTGGGFGGKTMKSYQRKIVQL